MQEIGPSEVSGGEEVIKTHMITVLLRKEPQAHKLAEVCSVHAPSSKRPAQEQPAHLKTIFPYNTMGIAPQIS